MHEFFVPAGGFPGALTYNAHFRLLFLIPNVGSCDQLPNAENRNVLPKTKLF
jgi:hypothetical protein